MSDLVYQNYNNKCQGWVNPSSVFFGPQINSLSGYQSPSGSNTVVAINGLNFFSYSTIRFGTFTPTVYFINSTLLEFYVPNTLSSGTFPVQVCNGSICSNIVNYTIDNASGYWLLNSNGSITNTNTNGVGMSWLSRGAPVSINSTGTYTVPNNVSWIICNNSSGVVNVTLPTGPDFIGREIMFKVINSPGNNVLNTASNILPINSITTTQNTIIDAATYYWVTLVYDGTNWNTMQCG